MSDTAVEPEEDQEPAFIPASSEIRIELETKKFVMQALLEKASSVLPSKDVMPVLKNFQLEASDRGVQVVATDLELSIVAKTEMVAVKEPGSAVFPGKRILELVREADDSDIILSVENGKAHIAVGRTTWDLMLMDGSEYPPIPDVDEVELHNVDRGKFLGALSSVRYAAATE